MYDVVLLREFSSTLKINLSLQEYQEDECKSLIKVPNNGPIQKARMVNIGN